MQKFLQNNKKKNGRICRTIFVEPLVQTFVEPYSSRNIFKMYICLLFSLKHLMSLT